MIGLTIRVGAAYDTLTTDDGQVIDRSKLTKPERRKAARMVRDIWAMKHSKEDA